MGSVWKAEHLLLHSHVAVKIIDPDVARLEFNLARFLREAKTLATLRSPHVVQVLDFGSDAETPYLVMELLHGQTLGRRISAQGRMSLRETCRVLQDVCAAMSLVHEQGLIHRDLKPENIFLCDVAGQRVTKVVDFGIAKSMRGDMTASMKTRTGHMLGTPSYMSPEQCRGLKDIDHRADLWALGVIAYECLVGKVPFEGEVLGDLLLRICMDPLPIPSQRARGPLPPAFDAWFAKAVHRDRAVRFQSALELATSLSELSEPSAPVREAPEPSRPSLPRISFVPPMPVPRSPSNTETNTTVGLVGSARRSERRARVAAAAAAAVVMVFGVWALGRKRDVDVPVNVEVESLRPAFEVTPKVIQPRVPTGRRWSPSSAVPSIVGGQPSDAAPSGGGAGGAAAEGQSGGAQWAASQLAASQAALLPEAMSPPAVSPPAVSPPAVSLETARWAGPGTQPTAAAAQPRATADLPSPLTSAVAPAGMGANRAASSAAAPAGSAPNASGAGVEGKGGAAPRAPNAEEAPVAPAPPAAAEPPSAAPPTAAPRPSHGRQLSPPPPPPQRPLRGTAAPAAPSRARPQPPSEDDGIRPTR